MSSRSFTVVVDCIRPLREERDVVSSDGRPATPDVNVLLVEYTAYIGNSELSGEYRMERADIFDVSEVTAAIRRNLYEGIKAPAE